MGLGRFKTSPASGGRGRRSRCLDTQTTARSISRALQGTDSDSRLKSFCFAWPESVCARGGRTSEGAGRQGQAGGRTYRAAQPRCRECSRANVPRGFGAGARIGCGRKCFVGSKSTSGPRPCGRKRWSGGQNDSAQWRAHATLNLKCDRRGRSH